MAIFQLPKICCALFVQATILLPGILAAGELGKMTREIWTNLPGGKVSDFTNSPRYWQTANTVTTFTGAASPRTIGDNYASRVRAYITAPASGNYTFWIASDDTSELWLSPNASKFGRVRIASVASAVSPEVWDAQPSQKSALIPLLTGHR